MNFHQIGNGILLGFPSIIVCREFPNHKSINPALASFLRADREKNPTPSDSAVKGWQSSRDLAIRATPELSSLFGFVGSSLLDASSAHFGFPVSPQEVGVSAEAWGNIQQDRDFTAIHNHAEGNHFSGVYYVEVGNEEDNGVLDLVDPRTIQHLTGPGKFSLPQREITIRPRNGLFVAWPSWMKHLVYPLNIQGERISIAFNAKIVFSGR